MDPVLSFDYYTGVDGSGAVPVTNEQPITFPFLDATLEPVATPGCVSGQGPLAPGESYCATQDGTTGDTTDSSGLWNTIGGVAGTFLRSFTGGKGVTVGASANTGKLPSPPAQVGPSSNTLILAGFGLVILVFVVAMRRN